MKISAYQRYRERVMLCVTKWPGENMIANIHDAFKTFDTNQEVNSLDQTMGAQRDIIYQEMDRAIEIIGHLSSHMSEMPHIIKDWIVNSQGSYIDRSRDLYQTNFTNYDPGEIFDKQLCFTQDQIDLLVRQVSRLARPHETAMIIRPGNKDWLDITQMFDQTYLFDNTLDLVLPAWQHAIETMQDKLLCYHGSDVRPFENLPRGQMSVIFANSFFNYKSLDVIYHYLWEFSTLLTPTGSVIMTINDCDHAINTEFFENEIQCYTPTDMVKYRALELGFVIANQEWFEDGIGWIELRRQDKKYRNLKAGAVLTKIHARSK
jgi:hypothetical protein